MRGSTIRGLREVGALLALILSCVFVLVPTYALAEGETTGARVKFFQIYDVEMSGLENTFTYLIEPQESDAPLPIGDEGDALRQFSMRRDKELWLEFVVSDSVIAGAGELRYHYILRPERTSLTDGLYYVDTQSTNLEAAINIYYLEIYVRSSNEDANATLVVPIVHIEGFDGPKVTDPGWRISYKEEKEEGLREIDGRPRRVTPRYPNRPHEIDGVGGFTYYYDRLWYDSSDSGDSSKSSGSSSANSSSTTGDSSGSPAPGADAGATGSSATGQNPNATGAAPASPGTPARAAAVAGANAAAGAATPTTDVGAPKQDLAATADVQDGVIVLAISGLAVALIMLALVVRRQKGR